MDTKASKAHPQSTRGKGQWRRLMRRLLATFLLIVALISAGISLVPNGRAAVRAAFLLPALVTAEEPAPLALLGEPIVHTRETIAGSYEPIYLDIFAPAAPPPPVPGVREGVLVIAGVGDNRTDAQYLNLMRSLARSGLVAVAMTTPTLMAYRLLPQETDAIVTAFQQLIHMPHVGAARSGILGFSAGGSLASVAVTDPRIRHSVAFVTSFGGYFDAETLLADLGRRAVEVNGKSVAWQPSLVTVQVLANSIATTLPPADGQILQNAVAAGARQLTAPQIASLSPAGQAAYHLLAGDQPARVDANIAALPGEAHVLLARLSPAHVVPGIQTPIYILHDRNDIFVPFTQSRAFAAALDTAHKSHEFVEFSIFQHVEVRSGLGLSQLLGDGFSLFRVLTSLLLPAS